MRHAKNMTDEGFSLRHFPFRGFGRSPKAVLDDLLYHGWVMLVHFSFLWPKIKMTDPSVLPTKANGRAWDVCVQTFLGEHTDELTSIVPYSHNSYDFNRFL